MIDDKIVTREVWGPGFIDIPGYWSRVQLSIGRLDLRGKWQVSVSDHLGIVGVICFRGVMLWFTLFRVDKFPRSHLTAFSECSGSCNGRQLWTGGVVGCVSKNVLVMTTSHPGVLCIEFWTFLSSWPLALVHRGEFKVFDADAHHNMMKTCSLNPFRMVLRAKEQYTRSEAIEEIMWKGTDEHNQDNGLSCPRQQVDQARHRKITTNI